MSTTKADKEFDRTKIQLMRLPNAIFYTTILFSLKHSWDTKIETAATDGLNLIMNPDFFLGLKEKERLGLLVHEILHVALNHMSRLGDRHPVLWNMAADYVINSTVTADPKYALPKGALLDTQFANKSSEQVYKILYDKTNKKGKGGMDGLMVPGGADIQYPKDSKDVQIQEQKIVKIVQKAHMAAKTNNALPGNIPAEIEIQIDEVTNPKLPWHVILQNYLSGFAKDDYSWRRPNRRYQPEYYLPCVYSEAVGEIAQAFDLSGSVEPYEISHFVNETSVIQEMLHPEKITVLSFDTKIKNIQEIDKYTDVYKELKLVGRGGTKIKPVLQWAIDNNPTVLLIFTDGEFSMPDKEFHPTCPIIWLIHGNEYFTAPFGEIIHYEINK